MESLLFPIIMLAVTLIGGGILLLFLKTSKKPPQTDAGSTAMQTAQQFINSSMSRTFGISTCIPVAGWYLSICGSMLSVSTYTASRKRMC